MNRHCKSALGGRSNLKNIYEVSISTTIKLPLRRTLVLQQFYSSIVAIACTERSEGFSNSAMRKYSFILKNEKTKNYRLISQLLVLFNLLGFVFLLINNETRIASNIALLFAILITSVYTFFTVMEWVSKKSLPEFWHRSIFGVCAVVWYKEGFWWITIMLFLFILLDFIAQRKLVVDVTDKKIIVPYAMQKKVDWNELNNVMLKDGLLTIDFKNNKLFQQLILNSDEDINEKEFNNFCKQQLNK